MVEPSNNYYLPLFCMLFVSKITLYAWATYSKYLERLLLILSRSCITEHGLAWLDDDEMGMGWACSWIRDIHLEQIGASDGRTIKFPTSTKKAYRGTYHTSQSVLRRRKFSKINHNFCRVRMNRLEGKVYQIDMLKCIKIAQCITACFGSNVPGNRIRVTNIS